MKRSVCRFLVASSVLCGGGFAPPLENGGIKPPLPEPNSILWAATRPRYGGTLRVEMQARVSSLDPGKSPDDFAEAQGANKLRALVYDRLARLDPNGQPQPALAVSWKHDAANRTWRFRLRPGLKWHDGSPLTPAETAKALNGPALGDSWNVVGDTLEIDAGGPRPEFPVLLAAEPGAVVFRNTSDPTSTPVGTGPFRIVEWQPGRRAVLAANDDYWGGRPFLDKIQVEMGRSSRDQLIDLELDKADIVDLDPAEARRAQQEGRRIWSSAPVELLSLHFNLSRPAAQDKRLREALALAIDRSAIQKVLLRNFGETAKGIFPDWLTGYGFLFSTTQDVTRARQLKTEIGPLPPLKLGYDPVDSLARQVAERLAVNARDVGIQLELTPLPRGWRHLPDATDARVERDRIDGPTLEQAVLQAAAPLGLPGFPGFPRGDQGGPETIYAAERRFLDTFAIVPLVCAPELVGLGPRVKDWSALRWGDWQLDDVWLENVKP